MLITNIANTVEEMKSAWQEFMSVNNRRLSELEKKGVMDPLTEEQLRKINNTLDECKARVATMEIATMRPSLCNNQDYNISSSNTEHKSAFINYLRTGSDKALQAIQRKSMSVASDADGGYLVTPSISKSIIQVLTEKSPIRQLASSETISTDSLDIIEDYNQAEAGWANEIGPVSETETPKINKKRISVHELYAQPKATQKLIDDANINIEKWLINKLIDIFSTKENQSFISGNGEGKPRGILSYDHGKEWGKIEQINSGVNADFTVESLFFLFFALKDQYASKATFLMHRSLLQTIRTLKDPVSKQYLWSPGLTLGTPSTLLGLPVAEANDMPMASKGSLSIVLADFNKAYKIVDRMGVRVLRDPFTEKPFVKFYTTKRVGGDVVNYEAIKILKLAE
ncbi:putative phage phi-C31 gp36 major capsid-like protein [Rickettsiales bacterium Ac37b]|nr:putative phage phi-C31 gp36 major capsid-like protein [Rickettsiales bacterium Ac37b]